MAWIHYTTEVLPGEKPLCNIGYGGNRFVDNVMELKHLKQKSLVYYYIIYFKFLCMYVLLHMHSVPAEVKNRWTNSLVLKMKEIVRHILWVLWTEF